MSETETIEREKKKRKNQYPTLDVPDLGEYEQNPQKETEQVYTSREQMYMIREKQREAVDQFRAQQDLLRADMEKFHTNISTKNMAARDLKMKGDLSNLIRATLSDETITAAKGKETERQHRKVLGGLYHSDHETTTEIEIRRGDSQ